MNIERYIETLELSIQATLARVALKNLPNGDVEDVQIPFSVDPVETTPDELAADFCKRLIRDCKDENLVVTTTTKVTVKGVWRTDHIDVLVVVRGLYEAKL